MRALLLSSRHTLGLEGVPALPCIFLYLSKDILAEGHDGQA